MNPQEAQGMPALIVPNVLTQEDIATIHKINKIATTEYNFVPSGNLHKVTFLQSSIHDHDDEENKNDNHDDDDDNENYTSNIYNKSNKQSSAFEELGGSIILSKIIDTILKTDSKEWNFLSLKDNKYEINPLKVNIRVIEYHGYDKFGGLMQKCHYDGGSILTSVLMLSHPNKDFEGGTLMTWEKNNSFKKYENIKQGDMLLFPSHKYHCVSQLTKGERFVLVIELWQNMHGNEFDKNRRPGSFGYLIEDSMSSTM